MIFLSSCKRPDTLSGSAAVPLRWVLTSVLSRVRGSGCEAALSCHLVSSCALQGHKF